MRDDGAADLWTGGLLVVGFVASPSVSQSSGCGRTSGMCSVSRRPSASPSSRRTRRPGWVRHPGRGLRPLPLRFHAPDPEVGGGQGFVRVPRWARARRPRRRAPPRVGRLFLVTVEVWAARETVSTGSVSLLYKPLEGGADAIYGAQVEIAYLWMLHASSPVWARMRTMRGILSTSAKKGKGGRIRPRGSRSDRT